MFMLHTLESAYAVTNIFWNGKVRANQNAVTQNVPLLWIVSITPLTKSESLPETVWFEWSGKTHPAAFRFFTLAQLRCADSSIGELIVSSCFCCVDRGFCSLALSAQLTLVLIVPLWTFPFLKMQFCVLSFLFHLSFVAKDMQLKTIWNIVAIKNQLSILLGYLLTLPCQIS